MKDTQKHFEKTWKTVSEENRKISIETDRKIWTGIETKIKQSKSKQKYYWITAAVLVPLFGILFFYKNFTTIGYKEIQPIVYQTENFSKTFKLSDNSTITLEPYSKLSLEENFGKENREVEFQGKGLFSIEKDKSKPFVVDAGDFKVEVLGTKFLVDQKSKEKKVELFEGKVKIEYLGKLTFLKPKEIWLADEKSIEHHFLSIDHVKTFSFENRNYSEVIKMLEEAYHVQIEYPSIYKNERINGSFTGNFEDILSIVSYPFNLKVTKINENKIILK
ncbi:FecR family protein [Elizabethkingia anophelis]|nr:FecR family protein [Elizabethkingia anophelis]MCT4194902.1 FecR family protein [Elizabethkingia anophelis]